MIHTKCQPWHGPFSTTKDGKSVALQRFGTDLELKESLEDNILTSFRASGYWSWLKSNGTDSRDVIGATLDEELNFRCFKTRVFNHATVSNDVDFSIDVAGPYTSPKADLKLEVVWDSWRVLSAGGIEHLKIPIMDRDKSFYIPQQEIACELVVEDARWREAVNQVLVAAQEAIGAGRMNPLSWDRAQEIFFPGQRVQGRIVVAVNCGFIVDLSGVFAFLPRPELDVRSVRDASPLMDLEMTFQILELDSRRGNIIVSRRAVLEEQFFG